jgi:predicted GIY-YIG superfamily endonuclease
MYYVYCIESVAVSGHRYIGFTEDLRQRVADHNRGCNPSTPPYVPWKLRGYIAFDTELRARAFKKYLKTGSGHAFRKKRLW